MFRILMISLTILIISSAILVTVFYFGNAKIDEKIFCFEPIQDSDVALDVEKVNLAVESMGHDELWGIRSVEDSVEKRLSAARRALFRRYWELETIQNEKPGAPIQFDLMLFAEGLDFLVEMDEEGRRVKFNVDKFEEWAKRRENEEMKGMNLSCVRKQENDGPIGIAKLALKKIINFNLEEEKVKIEEKIELEQIEGPRKRSTEKESEGKILALKKHLLENLMKTANGKYRKRDEKLAYIWYAELEYWIEKQIEKNGIKNGNGQEEMEKMDFLQAKLAESNEKMAKLRIWIGKDYRRRK